MEVWKEVIGFEGKYEVSNLGKVRSLSRKTPVVNRGVQYLKTVNGRIIKPMKSTNNYFKLNLCNKIRYVHHLVAQSFIGPRPIGHDVCHNDGNKLNNKATNIRYGTRKENQEDAIKHKQIRRNKITGRLESTK